MQKIFTLFFLVIAGIMQQSVAQIAAQNIDSLWAVYNSKTQADTARIKAINDIAYSYRSNKPDTAIVLAQEELKLANTLPAAITKKWIAAAYNTLSVANRNKSNYPAAMDYALKALKSNEELNDKKGMANCYISIGLVYMFQTNPSKALEFYLKALPLREEIKDKEGLADCYNRIGNAYGMEQNYSKALEYGFKSLQLREEMNDKYGIGKCCLDIGTSYYNLYNYPKTLEYFIKSLTIRKEINDKQGIGVCYLDLGEYSGKVGEYKKALQYTDSSLKIFRENQYMEGVRTVYENLAGIYSKAGKYKEAYENYIRFKQLTDSIFNADNSEKLNSLANNFEAEKKAAEQAKLDAIALEEKKRQQVIIYAVAGVLLIVFIFSVFLYRRFKITQHQKEVIEKQKELVEEKQKEILDSIRYAKRIQTALITSEKYINNAIDRMKNS